MKGLSALVFGALLVAGCGPARSASMQEVIRDIHAAWNEDGTHLLIVESRYRTKRPEEPYFNATSARDWKIRLYEAGPVTAPLSAGSLASLLENRKPIGGWDESAEPGGSLMSGPLYWNRPAGIVVGMENQQAVLYRVQNQQRIELAVPDSVTREMVGAELAPAAFPRSPAPAPDGETVAVFYTAPFQPGRDIDPLRFRHFVAFFAARDGRHLSSRKIQWPDDMIDMQLNPHARELPQKFRYLWARDSSGVYVLDSKRAVLVPVDAGTPVAKTTRVPARALQTAGGAVSPRGDFIFLAENHAAPNARKLELRRLPGWLPFARVPLAPLASIRYSVP